jgi:hypothetical protein
MVTLIKWSSFQKSVSKFTPKKFYQIYPSTFMVHFSSSLMKRKNNLGCLSPESPSGLV